VAKVPSVLREVQRRYWALQASFAEVDARYQRGAVTVAQWDRARAGWLAVNETYVRALEREVERLAYGRRSEDG
jgi:hypothetical protein